MHSSFHGLIRTPAEQRDVAAINASATKTGEVLQMLESYLEKNNYVAGQHFSKGDIIVCVFANRYFKLPIERVSLPNVEAWIKRLSEREGYKNWLSGPLL